MKLIEKRNHKHYVRDRQESLSFHLRILRHYYFSANQVRISAEDFSKLTPAVGLVALINSGFLTLRCLLVNDVNYSVLSMTPVSSKRFLKKLLTTVFMLTRC